MRYADGLECFWAVVSKCIYPGRGAWIRLRVLYLMLFALKVYVAK